MSPDLSIVICTHNRYDVLYGAIASIEGQFLDRSEFELLIIDNSTDLAAQSEFVDSLIIDCEHKVIFETTPGLSRARNLGVNAARGRVVAFIDDDARAAPEWATEILGTFGRHLRAAVVGGPVRPIWPAARPPWLHKWHEGFLTIVDRGKLEYAMPPEEWLAGTNIAFLREPLLKTAMFDERLGRAGKLLLSNEELQVTNSLRQEGYEIVYSPKAEMRHIVHADRLSHDWMRRRMFWQTVSDIFAKQGGAPRSFDENMKLILDYQQAHMRPKRGVAGMFEDTDDPVHFHSQLEALASLIMLMGTDGRDFRAFIPSDESR